MESAQVGVQMTHLEQIFVGYPPARVHRVIAAVSLMKYNYTG